MVNDNNNDNNNNNNNNNNSNNNHEEWKTQLIMQNHFISAKDFEDTRTIYSARKPAEIFMGSDTENTIDTLFNTILNRIQQTIQTSNERVSRFTHESVAILYYYFQRIDIIRAESHIISPDWIASKKATTNLKIEKDNECFKWSIIAGLNYDKIKKKRIEKVTKI